MLRFIETYRRVRQRVGTESGADGAQHDHDEKENSLHAGARTRGSRSGEHTGCRPITRQRMMLAAPQGVAGTRNPVLVPQGRAKTGARSTPAGRLPSIANSVPRRGAHG